MMGLRLTKILAANFSNSWIANKGPNSWPYRSQGLTPIDSYGEG